MINCFLCQAEDGILDAQESRGSGDVYKGHGLGKAKEVQEAITKGIEDAKKNLIKVPIMHGTIPVSYTHLTLPTIYSV